MVWRGRRFDPAQEPKDPPAGSLAFVVMREVEMKQSPALLAIAASFTLVASPSFGAEPKLNVKAICQSRAADARMLRSTPAQSRADCEHDEQAAKEQLVAVWASTSAATRNRCQSDARSLGTTSYLDLLTCIQMEDETKSGSKKPR